MSRVRIIGGGLTGITAAFIAHRLGCRDIELHERSDRLGGAALPAMVQGFELRSGRLSFGPRSDPLRDLLEWHGLAFEDVEDRCGGVSPDPRGERIHTQGAGPALVCRDLTLTPPAADTLAARLRGYPTDVETALARYCHWRLGAWLDRVHADAAQTLAIERVRPLETDPAAGAQAALDPRWGQFYDAGADSLPPPVALPRDGFAAFFQACHLRLDRLGVRVFDDSFISPGQMAAAYRPGDVVVWAADPAPLFEAMERPLPALSAKALTHQVFRARWNGPVPCHVQNFTAAGSVDRVHVYRSRGETLVSAACVSEAHDDDLRREVRGLLAGFGGDLELGESLGGWMEPQWPWHAMDAALALDDLRAALDRRYGADFIAGGWNAGSPAQTFADLTASLTQALEPPRRRAAA